MSDTQVLDNGLTAQEYFDTVKDKKVKTNDEELSKYYDNAMRLLKKSIVTKQVKAANKLLFHIETIEKERELVKLGIDTFVYKDDVEEFIDNVAKNTVKIIELERYEREIPDEVVDVIEKTQGIFDRYYVVFTDYTGKVEKEAMRERQKEKDPILFGTFQSTKDRIVVERFYFLADWEDEYCDLTLDKMVSEMKSMTNKDITRNISTPTTIEELREQVKNLVPSGNGNSFLVQSRTVVTGAEDWTNTNEPKSIFSKVKTFLGINNEK